MPNDDILATVADLFTLLRHRRIKYVLVGGIALLQYVQGRNTEDIDLIMTVAALKKLPEITLGDQSLYFARGTYRSLQIDFLLTRNPLFSHVQQKHATQQTFAEQTIMCATVEGLLLLKLYALPSLYRQGDFARVGLDENDVATLLYYHRPDTDALTTTLAQYLSAPDLQAVEETLQEIRKRIARFQHGD